MENKQKNDNQTNNKLTLATRTGEPGFWREMWQQARLVWHLVRDPEVPIYLKALPFLGLVYLIIPVDLIPDLAPVLGQLDDATALLISSKIFIELAPPHIVARHLTFIRQQDGYSIQGADSVSDDDLAQAIVIEGKHEITGKSGKPE